MEAFLASFRAPSQAPVVSTTTWGPPPNPFFYIRRRKKPSSSVEPYPVTKLDSAEKAWKEMSVRLADPDIVSDPSEYQKLAHPVAELDEVVTKYKQFKDCERKIEEKKALQKENGDGTNMTEMIASELESLSNQLAELEEKLKKWSSRLVTSRNRDRSLEHLNHEGGKQRYDLMNCHGFASRVTCL